MISKDYTLGIDIGSTTVKIAVLDSGRNIVFSDYKKYPVGSSTGYLLCVFAIVPRVRFCSWIFSASAFWYGDFVAINNKSKEYFG